MHARRVLCIFKIKEGVFKLKKIFRSFIAMLIIVSLLPASAFAADRGSSDQILKDSAVVLSDTEVLEGGRLTVNEQIFPTEKEDCFIVQLDVVTAEDVSTFGASGDSAVMLIVDKSSSTNKYSPIMLDKDAYAEVCLLYPELAKCDLPESLAYNDYDTELKSVYASLSASLDSSSDDFAAMKKAVYSCYHRRAWFERKAVISFLDAYTADMPEGAKRYVSLASSHQYVGRRFAWTAVDAKWRDDKTVASWVLDYSPRDSEMWNGYQEGKYTYTNGSGSNIESAYLIAANNMADPAISGVPSENRHTVFFTDGEPSYWAEQDELKRRNPEKVSQDKQSYGKAYTELQYSAIESVVAQELFSMDVVWYGDATLKNNIYAQPDGISRFSDNFYNVSLDDSRIDSAAQEAALSSIVKKIEKSSRNYVDPWTVCSEPGDHMLYEGMIADANTPESSVVYDGKTNSVKWDIKKCTPVSVSGEAGSAENHYRLRYNIRLDRSSSGFVPGARYDTDKNVRLDYSVVKGGVVSPLRQAHFDIPAVTAFPPVRSASVRIIYDGNGNSSGSAPVDRLNPYSPGTGVGILGKNDMSKTNSYFLAWNTKPDGSGDFYFENDIFTLNEDTTLYAQWVELNTAVDVFVDAALLGGVGVDKSDLFDTAEELMNAEKAAGNLIRTDGFVKRWMKRMDVVMTIKNRPRYSSSAALSAGAAGAATAENGRQHFDADRDIIAEAIEAIAEDRSLIFYDITILQKITYYEFDGSGIRETVGYYDANGSFMASVFREVHELEKPLRISLPFDSKDKSNIAAYRHHDGEGAARLKDKALAAQGEECFSLMDNGFAIYVKKFSTFAIGYISLPAGVVPGSGGGYLLPGSGDEGHYAYIVGYTDGSVRPTDDMTRAEAATVFFRLLSDETRSKYLKDSGSFSDIGSNSWFSRSVSTMQNMGIVQGYGDGSFRADSKITRAEFAGMAAKFSSFVGDFVSEAFGSSAPEQHIKRAEIMSLINCILQRVPENDSDLLGGMLSWPDNIPGTWHYLSVQEATNSHEQDRKPNGYVTWTKLAPVRDWVTEFEK